MSNYWTFGHDMWHTFNWEGLCANKGRPFLKCVVFYMGKGWGGELKVCQDDLGHFFSPCLPVWFQKGASLRWLPCARACVRFGEDETFAASEAFMLHFEGERRRLGVENRSSGEENFLTNWWYELFWWQNLVMQSLLIIHICYMTRNISFVT